MVSSCLFFFYYTIFFKKMVVKQDKKYKRSVSVVFKKLKSTKKDHRTSSLKTMVLQSISFVV